VTGCSACSTTTSTSTPDCPASAANNDAHVSLAHANLVGYGLLSHARLAHFAHLGNHFIAELRPTVLFVRGPSTTSALISISNVVGVSSILKMVRVDAFAIVALVSTDLRPISVPQEEGQAMRKYALLLSAKLAVTGLMQEAGPLPAAIFGDRGAGFNVALRERFRIHTSSVPYFNS